MSLVRLLTSGKSLVGLKNPTSRYQMRSRHLLPKFGADKNPFAAPAPQEEPAPGAPASVAPMSPAEIAAANLKETKKLPTTSTPPVSPPAPAAAAGPGMRTIAITWFARWARKLNPLEKWPRPRPQSKSSIPRFRAAAVQGEFSLENVTIENIKVVRNDLREDDVEVVASRAAGKSKAPPVEKPARAADLAETGAAS